MIDPKELRIGNWIRSTAQGHIQVRANDIEKIESVFLKGQDYVQPIPLTTEWMERFGFDKRENAVSYDWYIGINHITHDWLMVITEMKGDSHFFYQNGRHTIKYVHQLQNLFFALTGEEL